MKPRQVLITGAGGFVGSTLASGFADLGWGVVGLDRVFDSGRYDPRVSRVTAELSDAVPVEVAEVDLVVHAAWVTTDAATLGITPARHLALNLLPLIAVLELTARTTPPAFVFLSSSGVFAPGDATEGPTVGTRGLTDLHNPTGASPYAAAKRAGEVLVLAELDQGTAMHVVRLGYLFGPGEVARISRAGVSLVAGWLAAARGGQPLEVRADDPARDWTFAPDLAAALERVVDGPPAGHPVHLGSPHVCTDSAMATVIAHKIPDSETVTVSATGRVKPPMVPSDVPALRGFDWTDPSAGVRELLDVEVAT